MTSLPKQSPLPIRVEWAIGTPHWIMAASFTEAKAHTAMVAERYGEHVRCRVILDGADWRSADGRTIYGVSLEECQALDRWRERMNGEPRSDAKLPDLVAV